MTSFDSNPRDPWWRRWVGSPRLLAASAIGAALAGGLTVAWVLRLRGTGEFAWWMTAPVAVVVAIVGLASSAGVVAALMQTRRDRWLALALFVALYGVSGAWLGESLVDSAINQQLVPVSVRECPVGDFALEDLDGNHVRLADLRGRVVMIDVWRTWCHPCVAEFPYLTYAHRLLSDEGLVLLAISDEPAELQRPVRDEYGVPYPMLIDDGSLPRPFDGVTGFPATFLIDREGCLVNRSVRGAAGLRRLIREVRGADAEIPWLSLREVSPAHGDGGGS